ncbi:LOW QUALITY PROTEIN: proteasome activator subunit 4 [Rhodamnia argentea]|uniref:LOW QUALITY PROTEIN: proteasome activator subunit 4 n=1 Tax=Rhodamnia argentea TaxID=178133 RepID=A0A8B8QP54_9MYRT|nr:LOW QUALITY PROTEIN: proteasome activator subunit 4 [Rhodamnia argentea]
MHLYNAWLPPPVAEETKKERESFAWAVRSVRESYRPDDPDSVYSTLKWITILETFIKAKSDVDLPDVAALVDIGLELFLKSQNKLYAQVRWGNIVVRVINKYRKKLSLKVMWRPLYDTLVHTHFTRSTGPEGWRLRQRHFETVTSLIQSCRRFFPPGSALEIWSEFKCLLENPWHNSSFEGSGFVRLFLPTNMDNQEFFSMEWIKMCINLWDAVPNSQFWNSQWAAIIARVIKNYNFVDWEPFLPALFARYLNMFEVPVANGSASYPFSVDVPRYTRFLFPNKTTTPAKAIAKAIVYSLKPGSSAQEHLEKLINILEQYYHPSNGGRWTYSLERFLFYMVVTFQKRLHCEQQNLDDQGAIELALGKPDRKSFVSAMLRLVDRGQYSKSENLSETVAAATSILSYVEPSLVLPFLASRFHMALETMTATHQLKSAVKSVAYAGRALFLTSLSSSTVKLDDNSSEESFIDLLVESLSNALLGMDANDPPKTLASMQLIGSIFSNMAILEDTNDGFSFTSRIGISEWLDEFLIRLFSLLLHLEPSSVLNEGLHSSATSGTFLVEDGPTYYCMLEVLMGRLSKSLYNQALKKISKFVKTNILPGAIAEVGMLCCACVHANPEEAAVHLVEPILSSLKSSLEGAPNTGYGGTGTFHASGNKEKPTLSPALEAAIDYQLKILSVAINYGGSSLLCYKDQFKEALLSAFDSPSWKVNGAGDHLLRSLLGSLISYYPVNQYKCTLLHPDSATLEKWISTKDYPGDETLVAPKWHIPSDEEVQFANELLSIHFQSALDSLLKICQTKMHSDPGDEKEHLKVTLLRIDSSLQGVASCLPDFSPSSRNGMVKDPDHLPFLIAGATGSTVGSRALREKAAEVMHTVCKYLLEKKSDDSILLVLVIRIMDALGNYGSMEYEEWSNHRQAWKLETAAIIEPSVNFIVSSHSKGKRRPRWAHIDKAYLHSTWRTSQSSYHLFRTSGSFSPSDHLLIMSDDLLDLSLHSYETVRALAGNSLLKMIKRWPSMISKCVLYLAENLQNPSAPEYAVLGSCAVLASQTVLKHLTMDPKACSAFLIGVLSSSHHESLKAQKAINELFVKYNIHFGGLSRNFFKTSDDHADTLDFSHLVSQIGSMGFDSMGLHWRYNLMANRVLLLLAMASRNDPHFSSKILSETAGHFLKNLKSQLPQTRILAISALNILLKESPYKMSVDEGAGVHKEMQGNTKSSLEGALTHIFQEEGFFHETFSSLSHVHIITDTESASSGGKQGNSSLQSVADKSITRFYFDFSSSWPRTPSWISLLGSDTFYSNFARIFKRLVQECGLPVLLALRSSLEEFANAKERSKQCVAAEALAGVLHSDVDGLVEAWDSWMMVQLQNVILSQSVESVPEWASCIRYAVTGKGKYGTRLPVLRERILDCLVKPLPLNTTTTVVAKRYAFLAAALIELSPQKMPVSEVRLHSCLLKELLDNMCHSSAQVRESIGVTLSVLCSNFQLYRSLCEDHSHEGEISNAHDLIWVESLTRQASEMVIRIQSSSQSDILGSSSTTSHENGCGKNLKEDVQWMETLFHFIISSLKSGRSSYLLDVLAGFIHPVISLQETSHKDLSTLAKAAFELLKWRVFWKPYLQKVVHVILSSVNDPNWRTRSATLTYLRTFMYRHTFILSFIEKKQIWETVGQLLVDNQVEVREHAAAVLAGLMKGGDKDLASNFRTSALAEANDILKKKRRRNINSGQSIASVHGAVLALAASVLSVPYDMPSWLPEHVTLLSRFAGEPSPVKSTVTKAVAEFRRTHADTWTLQKESFTEEQLEVLADTSSSSSYFA